MSPVTILTHSALKLFGHEIAAILVGDICGLWIGFGIVATGTLIREFINYLDALSILHLLTHSAFNLLPFVHRPCSPVGPRVQDVDELIDTVSREEGTRWEMEDVRSRAASLTDSDIDIE
ncbi:uncharacterized protein BXZ73DRAFT_110203 [Epithele typhae]|uniref:uncharacterized protein n=1 Tax=Epithele typhae TaxID=378194 RepID=UPI002007886F|nr:uncharacterized protein BXZ73DRAFT_110203 [Epithele typhae]KAH9907647.1 hypothetical protein BXZ73DRAFT_110203 [Epithele typhae]